MLTVLKRTSKAMECIFPVVVSSCTHRAFSFDDSSWFLCNYYNFMFFRPIKITTSIQMYAHILKSKVYHLGSFSSGLERTMIVNLFPWWSYMVASNFLHCSIFYVSSQETYLVFGGISNDKAQLIPPL